MKTWSEPTAAAPEGDPGHLIPDEAWLAVVAAAENPEPAPVGLYGLPDRTISARSHGGIMPGGPRMGVLHSAETPLRAGYAYSIAANWFATKATTSATVMIDPAETIRLLPDNVVSYAVGPRANGFTINVEQAGYARLTYAEWTTPAGRQQMARVALYMRECRDRWGIPLRWATDAQIRAAAAGGPAAGWCQHDDVRRVLGGTTHHDPTPHYPLDELMELARGNAPTPPLEEPDMTPGESAALARIDALLSGPLAGALTRIDAVAAVDRPFRIYQDTDPTSPQYTLAVLAGDDGLWWPIPSATAGVDYLVVLQHLGIAGQVIPIPYVGWFDFTAELHERAGRFAGEQRAAANARLDALVGAIPVEAARMMTTAAAEQIERRAAVVRTLRSVAEGGPVPPVATA